MDNQQAPSSDTSGSHDEFDHLVLTTYPLPIAANYRRVLESQTWQVRTHECINLYESSLRFVTLSVLSQYLIRDVDQVSDPGLDQMLNRYLAQATLGTWTDFLFLSLRAYDSKRERFFIPELYDLYWETSQEPNHPRKGLRLPFDRLVQIRNELAHRPSPPNEAGWETLGREALNHMRTILRHYSFLRHYELVRVIRTFGDEYEYEHYTGEEVILSRGALRTEMRPGWFYLSRQDQSLLSLHPLLIYWAGKGEPPHHDAALFNRLMRDSVEYVATVDRSMVQEHDAELVALVSQLIFYNLQQVKLAHKQVKLAWPALRQAGIELTARRMGSVQQKYSRRLYLQRQDALAKFHAFLSSDKGCFVLIGKSGVGKSSFVLSLADEYSDYENVCLIMYDAARLNAANTDLIRVISDDVAAYLDLDVGATKNLFAALDRQVEMVGKTLVIVFDAINENADAKLLLQQIDLMVNEARYPWLKVLITSRPHSWRVLRRGLNLTEDRYFCEQVSNEYSTELAEFASSLEPFGQGELMHVYEKYRQAYRLQTDYSELSTELKGVLRDPLALRLTANIFKDHSIPAHLQMGNIYDQYILALLDEDRIAPEDLMLLENELVPLMTAEGHYANMITGAQVRNAKTGDGRPLWELIWSDDLLSNGQPINSSFIRLADAEILAQRGSSTDYEVEFKYERFYEYFAARRLVASIQKSKLNYTDLIRFADAQPFLLNAVLQTLLLVSQGGDYGWVREVLNSSSPRSQGLVIEALNEVAANDLAKVQQLLDLLWEEAVESTSLVTLMKQLRYGSRAKVGTTNTGEAVFVATTLLEAGLKVGYGKILLRGASSAVLAVREASVIRIYLLWLHDKNVGWPVLERLFESATGTISVSRLIALSSCFLATLLIVGDVTCDPHDIQALNALWKSVREQVGLPTQLSSRLVWRLRREILLRVLHKDWFPSSYEPFGEAALSQVKHDRLAEVIELLDTATSELGAVSPELPNWYLHGDIFLRTEYEIALLIQAMNHPDAVHSVISDLFARGDPLVAARVLRVFYEIMPNSAHFGGWMAEVVNHLLIDYLGRPQGFRNLASASSPVDSPLTHYLMIASGNSPTTTNTKTRLSAAIAEINDSQTLAFVIDCHIAAFLRRPLAIVLEPLRRLLQQAGTQAASVLIPRLNILRSLSPQVIVDFLQDTQLSKELEEGLQASRFITSSIDKDVLLSTLRAGTALSSGLRTSAGKGLLAQVIQSDSLSNLARWLDSHVGLLITTALEMDGLVLSDVRSSHIASIDLSAIEVYYYLSLFAVEGRIRDYYKAYYVLMLGRGTRAELEQLAAYTKALPIDTSSVRDLVIAEPAWRASTINDITTFISKSEADFAAARSGIEQLNIWLQEKMGSINIPPVFPGPPMVGIQSAISAARMLTEYESRSDQQAKLASLSHVLAELDSLVTGTNPLLKHPERSVLDAIVATWKRIINTERGAIETKLEVDRNWGPWRGRIEELLMRGGQVAVTDLVMIPMDLRDAVLKRYVNENCDYEFDVTNNAISLGSQLYLVKRIMGAWYQVAEVARSSRTQFDAAVRELVGKISEALEADHGWWRSSEDWAGCWLDASYIFHDTTVPNRLPLVFRYGLGIMEDDIESLYKYLMLGRPETNHSQIGLLGLFCDEDGISKTRDLLYRKLRQVYACDVVVFGDKDLFKILASRSREKALRRLVLSQIDLVTVSPFTINGPTPDNMFFGREHDLRRLTEGLRHSSYAIIGSRRMGKTSVLEHLHRVRLPNVGIRTIYHDCSGTRTFAAFMSSTIFDCRPDISSNSPVSLGDLLQSPPSDRPLVLLLDEVDEIVLEDHIHGWQLFRLLRALANTGRLQVALSGERTLSDALKDASGPLYNFANPIVLGPLDLRAVEELVTRPLKQLEVFLENESVIVQRIYDFTAGHPSVVQRLCSRLVDRVNQRKNHVIDLEDVLAVVNDYTYQVNDFLGTFWDPATPLEKIISLLMVRESKPCRLQRIVTLLHESDLQPSVELVKDALGRLTELRAILKYYQDAYSFRMALFPTVLAKTKTIDDELEKLRGIYLSERTERNEC